MVDLSGFVPSLDVGVLRRTRKGCQRCFDADDARIEMRATDVYDPSQCCYVTAWECPECGRQVYREVDGEVQMVTPQGERL